MKNIDTSSHTSLFPQNKKTKRPSKLQQAALKRNDPARKKQLESITSKDAKVTIPDAIKDFARIKKAVDAAPGLDNSDKIEELKHKIKNGTYKVDFEALADKILEAEY